MPMPMPAHRPARFQSTRPVKGATLLATHQLWVAKVSIHAPREGRDAPPACGCRR